MDATRLRPLIEDAIESQRQLDVAIAAQQEAEKSVERARERQRTHVAKLKDVIGRTFVIYGSKVLYVSTSEIRLCSDELVNVPVAGPLPPPIPEVVAPPAAEVIAIKPLEEKRTTGPGIPLSGGKVPPVAAKK